MSAYYALLGNSPALSLAEISALGLSPQPMIPDMLVAIELENDDQAADFLAKTGGIVKVLKSVGQVDSIEKEAVLTSIVDVLSSEKKVTFALSQIGKGSTMPVTVSDVKIALKEKGIPARYISSSGDQLSAAVLLHQPDTTELILINNGLTYLLLQTVAIQNIDAWTIRDRAKPYADRKKGMLPPKVARIMINLALAGQTLDSPLVYDPFCGTGTVLIEAAMRNCQIIGSDIDQQSVAGTQANLEWLQHEYDNMPEFKVFHQDVTQPNSFISANSIDLIVTEPFLGKPKPQVEKLPNIFKGLEKLYLGAFKRWTTILKDGAKIVIVFPTVSAGKKNFNLKTLIDKLEKIGYTTSLEPLPYGREQAIVRREIYRFTYNHK